MERPNNKLVTTTIWGLALLLSSVSVSAEQPRVGAPDGDLGLAIAMQGDHALVRIRNTVSGAISQSIREQMALLPLIHSGENTVGLPAPDHREELAALAIRR